MRSKSRFSIYGVFLSSFLYVLSTTPKAVDAFSVDGLGKAVHIQRFDYNAYAKSVGIKLGKQSIPMPYGIISCNLPFRR